MMYSYPFFSFPHFRSFSSRYYPTPYVRQPVLHNNPYDEGFKRESFSSDHRNNMASSILSKNHTDKKREFLVNQRNESSYSNLKKEGSHSNLKKEKSSPKRTYSGFSFLNNLLHQDDRAQDEEFFDLFGLKLYHDDLLLLGLIFFLYKEDVKDEYLFFALILLLLS